MWNEENNKTVVNPVETEDGEFAVSPIEDDYEREIYGKRAVIGRVRWFSRSHGYGFVREDGSNREVFVHQSAIQVPGEKSLRSGQRVLFELCKLENKDEEKSKIMALNVVPIEELPEELANYKENS